MYRIIRDDTVPVTISNPSWVKKQSNGCYALCDENVAHGIVVDGVVYHVVGKPDIDGVETVVLGEISEVAYQKEQQAAQYEKQLQTEIALAELSILVAIGLSADTTGSK